MLSTFSFKENLLIRINTVITKGVISKYVTRKPFIGELSRGFIFTATKDGNIIAKVYTLISIKNTRNIKELSCLIKHVLRWLLIAKRLI